MPHEITINENGEAEAAFSLTPAWHGLGEVYDHVMTAEEAMKPVNWTVVLRRTATEQPVVVDSPDGSVNTTRWVVSPEHMATVREDNNVELGRVSDHYQIVQNVEAFSFMDALVEKGEIRYESAFSLFEGRKVILLARMPKIDTIVPNDDLRRYICMILQHDGMGAVRFGPVSTRVVCWNTTQIAIREGTTRQLSIRHKGNIKDKLKAARDILGMCNERFDVFTDKARLCANYRLTEDEWMDYLNMMCPIPDVRDPDYTQRRAHRLNDTRNSIKKAWYNERQNISGMQHSAWAAYCAVAEHIDHLPRRGATMRQRAETRFNVCLAGPGRDMKHRAFKAACTFAGV